MMIYLDDERAPKNPGMRIIKSYKECIRVLKENQVTFLSLDHDLGGNKSGYDVALFIVKEGIYIPHINIHSKNTVGRDNISQLIERYYPNTKVTFDTQI